jgi:hypothetical protein
MLRNIIEVVYSMEKINQDLGNGIVPPELDFSNGFGFGSNIDWNKVMYNSFYSSYEFYEKRYAKEIAGIPGFDQVVRNIVEAKANNDPLTEYNNRISEHNIDGRIISDTVLQPTCESEGER